MTVYFMCAVLLMMGLYCLVAKKNIVKKIIGIVMYKNNGVAPILEKTTSPELLERFVDPLPQALVLTSIVIGLGTLSLMVSMVIRLYEKHGTFDMSQISKLRG